MKLTELFRSELEREAVRTRRALEQVPTGRDDWKPHEKSMPLGRLAGLVASMPSWVVYIIKQDQIDIAPAGGGQYEQPKTSELVQTHDKQIAAALEAISNTTDDFLLNTNWKLMAGDKLLSDTPRHVVLRETINHLAHHRGQLTVYLRLNDVKVPAIYGPSADDTTFA